jgi:arylsulfatase
MAQSAGKPNVVVILVDDMGFSDIGCYGGEIPTPHIDRLAANGVRFTQFYNTARCSPTRASLLTGLYPHQCGMGHLDDMYVEGSRGYQAKISDDAVTIAEALKPAGYFTAMTGKWHVGQPRGTTPWTRGFDRHLNLVRGGVYYSNQKGREKELLYLNGKPLPMNAPELSPPWYSTDLWTTFGLKFIDESLAEKKPFFLYLAHNAPHFPMMAPPEEIAKFRGKFKKGWDKLREERYHRQLAMGLIDKRWPLTERPPDSPAWDSLAAAEQDRFDHMMAIYAATMSILDRNIGRLVDGLRERGVLENTLILFLSDNGGNAESGPRGRYEGENPGDANSTVFIGMNWATLNNTPFRRYKHFTHEGGVATPLIAHWPKGIPDARKGKFEAQPGHVVDLMPTVLEVAGATYPAQRNGVKVTPTEGVSLVPSLAGKPNGRTEPIYFMHEGNRGIRHGKWKLVAKHGDPWELYDLEADRTETRNQINAHPEIAKDLMARYEAWARRTHVDAWSGPPRTDWGQVPPAARK